MASDAWAMLAMQGIEGVPKVSQDYNPATWMLEVTNVAVEHRTGKDFAALYAASDMYRCMQMASQSRTMIALFCSHCCWDWVHVKLRKT